MAKPSIKWEEFLTAAPYFTCLLYESLDDETDISELEPNYRAALYFDIFCAEVSNGGVTQYFYNKALYLPNFDLVPSYIAQNPIFSPILHIVQAAHDAWVDCSSDVIKARNEDEWPDELFEKYSDKFDVLETEFYAKYHEVAQQFCHALILNPHDYFDIEPIANVPAKGVAYISLHNNTKHFRFKNGFPIGPNLFETRDKLCKSVTFNDDRSTMECIDDGLSYFIHYPSQRSITKRFNDGVLESLDTQFAFWGDDGIREHYYPTGQVSMTSYIQHKEQLGSTYLYPSGQISMTIEKQKNAEIYTRYWPNGQKNVQYIQDSNFVQRYFWCFDEQGQELAPNGTGKLIMIYDETATEGREWAEGELNNGKLVGELKQFNDAEKVKKASKLP